MDKELECNNQELMLEVHRLHGLIAMYKAKYFAALEGVRSANRGIARLNRKLDAAKNPRGELGKRCEYCMRPDHPGRPHTKEFIGQVIDHRNGLLSAFTINW